MMEGRDFTITLTLFDALLESRSYLFLSENEMSLDSPLWETVALLFLKFSRHIED